MRNLFNENDKNNVDNEELKVIIELKNLYENIYDKLIDKENDKDENNKSIKNANNIYIHNEYHLENIDKIKE